jgi:hypothetical protein
MAASTDSTRSDWVWALIYDGELDAVMAMLPANFDWRGLHPTEKCTLLHCAIRDSICEKQNFQRRLDLIEWLIERGADPTQESRSNDHQHHNWWKRNDKEGSLVKLKLKDTSAVSYAIKLRALFRDEMTSKGLEKANWTQEIKNLTAIVKTLADKMKERNPKVDRVKVDSSVVEMWERLFAAKDSHDVTLVTADGPVTSHSFILAQASPVLAAMLSSTMREGCQKRIDVKDASSKGASFFLELLYTGTSDADIDCSDALVALDLSHRWQVKGVTAMLTRALENMITDEGFIKIAEAAVLKDLPNLQKACIAYASQSSTIQDKLKRNRGIPACLQELFGHP